MWTAHDEYNARRAIARRIQRYRTERQRALFREQQLFTQLGEAGEELTRAHEAVAAAARLPAPLARIRLPKADRRLVTAVEQFHEINEMWIAAKSELVTRRWDVR